MVQQAIIVEQLEKQFRSYHSRPGLTGAMRDLLSRQYTTKQAVDRISFSINQGEMVGYIGENGAGKSTTIKMLTGILQPTSGRIVVNGMDPHREREKFVQTIGVVFGQRSQLWWDIAVQESFRLLKKVYKVSDEQYRHMEYVIETLNITELLNQPVRKLSLGQRMRCELAAALIHNPPLLFLDEPTIGLDVLVKLKIRDFLKEMNEKYRTTILLTTHDLTDIEALCERVIMLDEGKIIYDGALQQLKREGANVKQIKFEFRSGVNIAKLKEETGHLAVQWFKGDHDNVWKVDIYEADEQLNDCIRIVSAVAPIKDIHIHEVSTEEIVRSIYDKGL